MSLLLSVAASPIVTDFVTGTAPVAPAVEATTGRSDNTGYIVGFIVFIVVVLVVVALVVPILLLAHKIGKQAPGINSSLTRSLNNTNDLTGLEETIDHATVIVDGLYRARVQLGG
jgi:hypothetical protein